MIQAKVIYLSADTVSDQSGRHAGDADTLRGDSYIVRVRLDDGDAHQKVEHFQPTPGMPADIFIKTGERTFFTYLMQPVIDSFSRAFREH